MENILLKSSDLFATIDKERSSTAILKVVGVGGGGCNAVESMINRGLTGVEYIAINTDNQCLRHNSAGTKIQVGSTITRGLGAGADPNVGRKAVEEDRDKIAKSLEGADMVFVTAGMGGGTGTGGAPIVASIAKSLGSLVVGIVTKPFRWEGKIRERNAESGILELKQYVDSLIVIPNNRLLSIMDPKAPLEDTFDKPNEVLYEATRGIADIITINGKVNVDFADVRTVMSQSGEALIGCGSASGEHRAAEAAQLAISSPLLEGVNIKGAKNILLNITAPPNFSQFELDEGTNIIYQAAGEEANMIFGLVIKEEMAEYVSFTVIATGFLPVALEKKNGKTSQLKNPEPERDIFKGGFENAQYDKENLDVPTILRVKGLKNDEEGSLFPQSGFQIERLNGEEVDDEIDSNEEDRSGSSFLRMMMD